MSAAVVEGGTRVARGDGRQPNQLRPLGCEVGVMVRADGAARFSHGDSTVLATVTGPADISASREVSDRATIEVIWRAKSGSVSSIKDRRKEQQLSHVLEAMIISELHPRSSITLVIQEINNDGAVSLHIPTAAAVARPTPNASHSLPRHCHVTATSLPCLRSTCRRRSTQAVWR